MKAMKDFTRTNTRSRVKKLSNPVQSSPKPAKRNRHQTPTIIE